MTRNKKHIKGDQAELIAQEFFIKKGYYVFNNISQHGPVDMVVLDNDGYTLLIDVKVNAFVIRVPSEILILLKKAVAVPSESVLTGTVMSSKMQKT